MIDHSGKAFLFEFLNAEKSNVAEKIFIATRWHMRIYTTLAGNIFTDIVNKSKTCKQISSEKFNIEKMRFKSWEGLDICVAKGAENCFPEEVHWDDIALTW